MVLLSSTSMVPSVIELLTSTGTLSSVLVGAVVPALTRDMFDSVACLNLDKAAQPDGDAMMWVATPLASSMVATASTSASRSSVTVPPLVGDRLSRPAGRLIQSQYRAPSPTQFRGDI